MAIALGAAVAIVLGACSASDAPAVSEGAHPTPAERTLAVVSNPRLQAEAAQAEADGDLRDAQLLRELDATASGVWLTPERFPESEVGGYVASVLAEAGDAVPVLVVYGIPDRDCTGTFSAGGLSEAEYIPWVTAIASAAEDSMVVLEPDALATAVECGDEATRLELLEQAVGVLADTDVTAYVDAGHSYWRPPAEMAELLTRVGVDRVEGFATNVSNYQPEPNERAYAAELSGLLDDARYVIDTSRSGDPAGTAVPVEEWCNPEARALGARPRLIDDGTSLEGLLWIKPPAESDGTCNGGPEAGAVWIERALGLAERAGW